jgi:hypothetical protein
VNPQDGFQRERRAAAFGTGLEVVGLDQIDQRLPWHDCLHLVKKTLPLGAFSRGGLLVITVGEALHEALTKLLAAHESSHAMQSQRHCRVD